MVDSISSALSSMYTDWYSSLYSTSTSSTTSTESVESTEEVSGGNPPPPPPPEGGAGGASGVDQKAQLFSELSELGVPEETIQEGAEAVAAWASENEVDVSSISGFVDVYA